MKKLLALSMLALAALVAAATASGAIVATDGVASATNATMPACTSPAPVHTNNAIYTHQGAFDDVVNERQGSTSTISCDLSKNQMFDYNGDGFAVTWDPIPGWNTTAGYDMTTGVGTPNAPAYVTALAGP